MSTSTPESRELLRLYKCVVETGTGVLTAFAQNKLLAAYNGNFKQFLDDKKHKLFHLWQSKKLSCCECPPAGYNFKRMSHMDNWIFKKLYADNGPENRSHILRNGRYVDQMCLHKYITQNIAIHELDISAISFLLRNLIILSANENTTLDIITTTRSKICHAYSNKCYSMTLLNTTWTELENALVDLADPSYKVIIRQQIKYLRKVDLEKEEITELLSNVEEVLQAVKASSNNNNRRLIDMETRIENNAVNHTDDIKQHTTEETSYFASQAQHAISEKIQNTEENLEKEMKDLKKSQDNSCQKLETQLHGTRSEINDVMKMEERTYAKVMEMSKTIENLQLSVKCERPANVFVPVGTCAGLTECPVLWYMKTPKDWNVDAIEATILQNSQNKDEQFKVKFVRKGSLIMFTTVAASILSDPGSFEDAVMSFLTKMIEDCEINTKIPGRVDVTLHILNANEVSISCELPPEVRHKQGSENVTCKVPNSDDKADQTEENLTCKFPNTTTDDKAVQTEENVTCKVPNTTTDDKAVQTEVPKKRGSDLVSHDIAFLNTDNENEIKWVQRAAFLMKDKLGIECAIPGKDYLCGVPLKKLDEYFKRFRTVIVTITKDSHIASKYRINKFKSSIVVELDYRKSIPVDLRNMQYINGTLCEHLWFSQMAKVILKRHPDIERRISKQQISEVPVLDCKSCNSSASAAVYHKLKLWQNPQTQPVEALVCGSLTTEPFIIEVCNELVKLKYFDSRIRWEKSIASTYIGQQLFVGFVFVSKYLKNCKPLKDFITKHQHTAECHLYSTKIEETESPLFIKKCTTDMETSSMDPIKIAFSIKTILQYHGPMQPGQFHYHDYLSTVESVGYKDTIMTHMQKKKSLEFHPKEKERKERHKKPLGEYHQHSEEKELTSTYEDSFSKEYPDKTESTEFTEGLYKHWSKGHYLKDTDYAKLFAEYPDKTESTAFTEGLYKHWSKELYPKKKERKEPHTKQLGENQYPDKKESTGKSKNPWLKDPYLKNKDLPETHDFPSPPELEVSEIVEG